MNACVGEKSGGKMKLQGFWGGALGGDLQATQALRSGTQEMVITSTSPLVGILPDLGVFDLPFLFTNEKEADAVLDGPFGKYIADKLPAVGLVNLAYWENGFRNLTNSRKPVAKVEDFSGVKVRVMQNNIFLDTFKTVGANAVPMAFGEVFTALETKAIDGQENPFVTIDTSKFYEVQKYLSVTNHAYTPFLVLYSKQLFDKLSPEEQKALQRLRGGRPRRAAQGLAASSSDEVARQHQEGRHAGERARARRAGPPARGREARLRAPRRDHRPGDRREDPGSAGAGAQAVGAPGDPPPARPGAGGLLARPRSREDQRRTGEGARQRGRSAPGCVAGNSAATSRDRLSRLR